MNETTIIEDSPKSVRPRSWIRRPISAFSSTWWGPVVGWWAAALAWMAAVVVDPAAETVEIRRA